MANSSTTSTNSDEDGSKKSWYFWSFLGQFSDTLLALTVSIVMARLLMPSDYGLVAMVTVFSGFGNVVVDFGFGAAIVYGEDDDQRKLCTAFWLSTLLGLGLLTVFCLSAGAISDYYEEPSLRPLTKWVAFGFLFSGLSVVDQALLRRAMRFKVLAISRVLPGFIGAVVGVVLAVHGYGAMSIATQAIAAALARLIFLRATSKFRIEWLFSGASARVLLRYSAGVAGARAVNYWTRNADNLLIGKYLGDAALGLYGRAYALLMLPISQVSRVVTGVLFPLMSREKSDPNVMRDNFVKTARVVAFITFPTTIGLIVTAEDLVVVLYGAHWSEMAWIVQFLSVLGMYQSIVALYGSIFLATGNTGLDFRWSLVSETVIIVSIVVGFRWGLPGVIGALFTASVVNFVPTNLIPLRLIGISVGAFWRALLPEFVVAFGMGLAVFVLGKQLSSWPQGLRLFVEVVTGFVVYIIGARAMGLSSGQSIVDAVFTRKVRQM